jgi:putative transcription factor
MNCEICGREISGDPLVVRIEGSRVNTCRACARLGERISGMSGKQVRGTTRRKPSVKAEKIVEVVDDYANLVRKNREKKGITQDQLGAKINEKGSVISRIESGHMEPDLKVAKKLERFFSITLLEELEN